jgi:hypothetical protein
VMACKHVASALGGERPTDLVNPEVWDRRVRSNFPSE